MTELTTELTIFITNCMYKAAKLAGGVCGLPRLVVVMCMAQSVLRGWYV